MSLRKDVLCVLAALVLSLASWLHSPSRLASPQAPQRPRRTTTPTKASYGSASQASRR